MTAPALTAAMMLAIKYNRLRLNIKEIADELGISASTIYNRRAQQGMYVGQLYTNTDTGEDYKIVRNGKECWL